jgi:hypothetical protein
LKQVFSPAVRLWLVRELLPQNRYGETIQDFLELSDSDADPEEKTSQREKIQALLSQWARAEQWHYFVPAVEIVLQIAHQENRQEALRTLSKPWPEHLSLSKEGFIHYYDQPLLQYLKQGAEEPQDKEKSTNTAAPTEADSRKEMFQRIRHKRLLLLKQWESL